MTAKRDKRLQKTPKKRTKKEREHSLRGNTASFWGFELLYKLLGVCLFVPLLYGTFDLVMHVLGYNYLTLENIRHFFMHPLVYLWILVLLLLLGLFTTIDLSGVFYILHCSHQKRKTTVWLAFRFAIRNAAVMFRHGNRKMFLNVFLVIPFFCLSQIPELFATYSLPNLMLLGVKNEVKFVIGLLVLITVLIRPFLDRMFSFLYFSLENCSGKEANQKSKALANGNRLFSLVVMAGVQVFCYLLYMLFLALGVGGVVLFGRIFRRAYIVSAASVFILKVVLTIIVFIFGMLGTPFCCIAVSRLFYRYKKEKDEPVCPATVMLQSRNCFYSEREKRWREKHGEMIVGIEAAVLAASVGICSFYVYQGHKGEFNRDIEIVKTMEVTAHRGASRFFPENTMAAFQGALEAGADWIELDVHESKDGQIFVMHDKSFKRTTGVNALAWTLTYDEIAELDAGSFFSKNFEGERIPLLSEAIEFAIENDIRLNIEIKPSSGEPDLEERLVDLIHEYDFTEKCVVTSQAYNSIAKVKQLDEEITTVYVMGLAYGNINRLEYADAFSVRSSSISERLVHRVHNKGKYIYAWTVNTRDAINTMIDRNVDNIITDDVPLAFNCIGRKTTTDAVNDYIDFLNRQLRIATYHIFGR